MNDAVKDPQEEAAAPAAGFTPEPPPPQVDAADVTDALADAPDGEVPDDTAKKALEAVQILVENNRASSQQLESLMAIVLDAAEVANRSAAAVATTGGQLNKAAEKLVEGSVKTSMNSKIVLALAASVLVGSAGTFSFMTVQLNQKVEQVDAMLLAVGKRAVDLKTRMESMDDINASLAELNLKQDNTQSVQQAIEDKLNAAVEAAKLIKEAPKAAPAAAAKAAAPQNGETAKSLSQQLTALNAQLKEQSSAVKALSTQVNSVQGTIANVDGLKKEVESLSNLQRTRNQEAIQAAAAANARREKELKDKERELARERDLAKERELTKDRELAKERELAREREREKERTVQYSRQQSKPNASTVANGLPSFTRQGGTEVEKQ